MHQAHHQGDQYRNHQHQVDVGQLWTFVWGVFKNRVDVAISATALQLHVANPLALGTPQYEGGEDHPQGAADHGWQQRHKVFAGIQAQCGDGPCRGPPQGVMPLMMLNDSMEIVARIIGFMPMRLYSGNIAAQVIM